MYAIRSYYAHRMEVLEENFGAEHPSFRELWDLVADIEHLPEPGDPARASRNNFV